MRFAFWLAAFLVTGPTIARSEEPVLVLSGAGAGSVEVTQRVCPDDDLYVHHDGSFEGGIAWQYEGVAPSCAISTMGPCSAG